MKKLKKILLINWLYFSKELIEVGDINFLTGKNGAGKSTVIDALQIVLLGETNARNFNQAANDTMVPYIERQGGVSIKAAETRMAEIAVLKTHIVNYAKTHPVYDAYRKAGYSKKFLDTHREEITLHKVAKAAFDETGLKKLPKVKALNAEYSDLLTQKKAAYPDYRKAREEMQELVKAQKNIELFFAEEKDAQEKQQTR